MKSALFKNTSFTVGAILTGLIVAAAVTSLFWTPYDVNAMNPRHRLEAPSTRHVLGTDQYGRDLLSRVMVGAGYAIVVGLITVAIGMSAGVSLGLAAAHYRGVMEEAVMRFSDLLFGFPAVLTAIMITSVMGPSLFNAMLSIGIFYIPVFARLTRAAALGIRSRDYIVAARLCGVSDRYITLRHILPNIASPLLIQATIQFALAILAEAGLSYLGLGTQPPHPSWGRMLNEAQTFMPMAPWMALFPGTAIAWTVLGFNLLGDGLRDLLDPRIGASG